jgi:DNA-binding transcriptional MocR family regulator
MSGIKVEKTGTLSIRQFAESVGTSHTEVRRAMAQLGIEGDPQGKGKPTLLKEDEQSQIAQALGIEPTEPAAEYRQVEVMTGNHRATVEAPELPMAIDLAKFRGDITTRTYKDPVNEAAAALALFDALEAAMDSDLDQSFQQLETTAETVQKLQEKAESMAAKKLEYEITQKILARLQNQKTGELSTLLGKAQELGGGGGLQ